MKNYNSPVIHYMTHEELVKSAKEGLRILGYNDEAIKREMRRAHEAEMAAIEREMWKYDPSSH